MPTSKHEFWKTIFADYMVCFVGIINVGQEKYLPRSSKLLYYWYWLLYYVVHIFWLVKCMHALVYAHFDNHTLWNVSFIIIPTGVCTYFIRQLCSRYTHDEAFPFVILCQNRSVSVCIITIWVQGWVCLGTDIHRDYQTKFLKDNLPIPGIPY